MTKRLVPHRLTEAQVSIGLALVVLIFFVIGFLPDASPTLAVALGVVGFFIVVGLIRITDATPVRRIRWLDVATTLAGTLAVAVAVRVFSWSSVFSAAVVGIIAGLLPLMNRRIDAGRVAALYAGAFAGMTSPVVLLGVQWLVTAGLITGLLWSLARDAWPGIGGKMGTVAFAGVGVTTVIAHLIGADKAMVLIPVYVPLETALIVAVSIASAALSHWLAYVRRWGPVLASAAPTAVVVVATIGIRHAVEFPNDALVIAWFGASLIGGTAPARLPRPVWMIPVIAVVFTFLLINFQTQLSGLGGDLGTTVAAAVIAVVGLQAILSRWRPPTT